MLRLVKYTVNYCCQSLTVIIYKLNFIVGMHYGENRRYPGLVLPTLRDWNRSPADTIQCTRINITIWD